jgi:alpha-1,2-mannosyltransferase
MLAVAPWLLGFSVAINFALVGFAKTTMLDLLVYRDGAPSLLTGVLYDWRLTEMPGQTALPFTYPPFAALVLLPLAYLPWLVVRWAWQLISVACLWWLVRLALRLIAQDDHVTTADVWWRRAMLWTALALWVEPVRTTLNYGQINLVLAVVVLAGMASRRSLLSGLGVGMTAAIKLTPALSGIYFLATKRWAAAVWSVVAFAATVGIGYVIAPTQSSRYWFHVLNQTGRIGRLGSPINQSLRGALARTVGHDVGAGPIWLVAVAIAVVLGFVALRAAARANDVLAGIVTVQLFTLLVSPISWSHHWVWMVPAVLWLLYGATGRLAAVTAIAWLAVTGSFLVSFLEWVPTPDSGIPPVWYATVLGWAYPACALLTMAAIAVVSRGKRDTETTTADLAQAALN